MILAAAILLPVFPGVMPEAEAASVGSFEFPKAVANPLPIVTPGTLIDSSAELPDPTGTDFIGKLTGAMPEPRYYGSDRFLTAPSQPMPSLPGEGLLMTELVPAGEGEPAPTPISTPEELQAMTSGGSYVLTQDIDLSGFDWTPINLSGYSNKSLILDGNGHTIRGLVMTDSSFNGLFGYVDFCHLVVRNLILKGFSCPDPAGFVGALIGAAQGPLTAENCVVDNFRIGGSESPAGNSVSGMGGLAGFCSACDVNIRSCAVTGTILGAANEDGEVPFYPGSYYGLGGIIGYSASSSNLFLTDCITDFDIDLRDSGNDMAAGLVGSIEECYGTVSFLRCASYSDLYGVSEGARFAGLVMEVSAGEAIRIQDCIYRGVMDTGLGGLVGYIPYYCPEIAFRNCVSAPTIYNLTRCTDRWSDYVIQAFGGILGCCEEDPDILRFENCWMDGNVTLTAAAEYPFRYYHLGGIAGYVGENVTFTDCLNTGNITAPKVTYCYAGGLAGVIRSSGMPHILRCENRGNITGTGTVGGLVAYNSHREPGMLIFTDCKNTGSILTQSGTPFFDNSHTGGLVGDARCRMYNCINTGDVSGSSVGGLQGDDGSANDDGFSSFQNCRSSGTMTATAMAGGFIPSNNNRTSFVNCTANVALKGTGAGLVGNSANAEVRRCSVIVRAEGDAAGMILRADRVAMEDCYAVFSTSGAVLAGGLMGSAVEFTVQNSAADVSITGFATQAEHQCGGLVGYAGHGHNSITRSYATGTIHIPVASEDTVSHVGGLVGSGVFHEISSLTVGQCWGGVDIRSYGTHAISGALAGYVGHPLTVYSSWSNATLSGSGVAGGLVGSGENRCGISMQDCCFLGAIAGSGYDTVGGLIGENSTFVYNCYARGSYSGETYVGGLVGYGGGGVIQSCRFDGSVTAQYNAGGIMGACFIYYDTDGTVADCHTTGTVSGRTAGGIVGKGSSLYDCTSTATVQACRSCTKDHEHLLGGLMGQGKRNFKTATISNCHALSRISVSATGTTAVGGLAGEFEGLVVSSTSRGASASVQGLTSGYTRAAVGGLIGRGPFHSVNDEMTLLFENCQVTGSTYARLIGNQTGTKLSGETVHVGGLFGYAEECYIAADSCSVLDSVSGSRSPSRYWDSENNEWVKAGGEVDVGGLGGFVTLLKVDNCTFTGTVSASPADDARTNHRLLGYNEVDDGSVTVQPPEPEEVNHTFIVKALPYGVIGAEYEPIEGAQVSVGGIPVGTTDKNGTVSFTNSMVLRTSDTTMQRVTAYLEGYTDASRFTYLADGDTTTLYIAQRNPNSIYIQSVQYQEADSQADLLSHLTDIRILEIDKNYKKTYVSVDWNNMEPEMRTVYLSNGNEIGSDFVAFLDDGTSNYIRFAELYKPGEAIYVTAKAYDENGNEITAKKKLSIQVDKLAVHLPTSVYETPVSSGGATNDGPYFLKGLNWAMGFGDIGPFAGDISLKNGYLKAKFSGSANKSFKIPLWKAGASGSGQVSIGLEGSVSIPYTDTYHGEWSGSVGIVINDVPEVDVTETASVKYSYGDEDKGVFSLKYPFTVTIPVFPYVVPCFFDTMLDLGGTAALDFSGPYDKVEVVSGRLDAAGYGEIFAGVGVSVEDAAALKFGGEGTINPKYTLIYSSAGDSKTMSIRGTLSARALVKAFDHNIEAELQLGSYLWDGQKTTWTVLGEDMSNNDSDGTGGGGGNSAGGGGGGGGSSAGGRSLSLAEVPEADWSPLSRAYLEHGGGFLSQSASLLGFSSNPASLRYENIGEVSQAVLTEENGRAVLYFTADDGLGSGGLTADHTALFRSVLTDGSWSAPAQLSGGGYADTPHADGAFAVWTESGETGTLVEMLTSTDIKVSVGGVLSHTFEGNGYVYAPKVSANGTSATVTWLRDPSLTGEGDQGQVELWYATCTEGTWSAPARVETVGIPVSSQPDCAGGCIY